MSDDLRAAHLDYLLSQADTQLVLGHRLSEWAGHGPMLEEDIALSNLGLDLLGQARSLYTHAGALEGKGRCEDQLAYFRDATSYRNLLLVEQPNGDFAFTMMRHFFFSVFYHGYWRASCRSVDASLAAIADKAVKELAYHQRHSSEWIIRLGDGTEESHSRAQRALNTLWSFTGELFEVSDTDQCLIDAGIAVDPTQFKQAWESVIHDVLDEATLQLPPSTWLRTGGRQGQHTEHLGYLLAEMQHLQRTYPGVTW